MVGTWLLMAKGFKFSSLSALVATALSPIYAWLLNIPMQAVFIMVAMVFLLWRRHRGNIQRLMRGSEERIGNS